MSKESDFVDLLNKEMYELKIADLEAKLAESEKSKESYRLQNEQHHLQLLQFYSRLGVEAFGADIHEKALETLMLMKEQLAEKDKEIKKLKTARNCSYKQIEIWKHEFAVEQLEKVKENIHYLLSFDYNLLSKVNEQFDNQIKQLKEGK